MTRSQNIKSIHPSIVMTNDKNTAVDKIPICLSLLNAENEQWSCCAEAKGSLKDFRDILEDLIEGANESCADLITYQLDKHKMHLWNSLEAFEKDKRRKDFNNVAVFCSPLSYLEEQKKTRRKGREIEKLIYQIKDEQLEQHNDLKEFYSEFACAFAQKDEHITIYKSLDDAAQYWFDLVKDLTLSDVPASTRSKMRTHG